MARTAKRRTMGRAMSGELNRGRKRATRKVKRRKQAMAIALQEAGAPKYATKRAATKRKRKVKARRAKRKTTRAVAARRVMGSKKATKRARAKTARKVVRRSRVRRALRSLADGMGTSLF